MNRELLIISPAAYLEQDPDDPLNLLCLAGTGFLAENWPGTTAIILPCKAKKSPDAAPLNQAMLAQLEKVAPEIVRANRVQVLDSSVDTQGEIEAGMREALELRGQENHIMVATMAAQYHIPRNLRLGTGLKRNYKIPHIACSFESLLHVHKKELAHLPNEVSEIFGQWEKGGPGKTAIIHQEQLKNLIAAVLPTYGDRLMHLLAVRSSVTRPENQMARWR